MKIHPKIEAVAMLTVVAAISSQGIASHQFIISLVLLYNTCIMPMIHTSYD